MYQHGPASLCSPRARGVAYKLIEIDVSSAPDGTVADGGGWSSRENHDRATVHARFCYLTRLACLEAATKRPPPKAHERRRPSQALLIDSFTRRTPCSVAEGGGGEGGGEGGGLGGGGLSRLQSSTLSSALASQRRRERLEAGPVACDISSMRGYTEMACTSVLPQATFSSPPCG